LHYGVSKIGNIETLSALVAAGADVNIVDKLG
jgi:hypothetical protein